MNEGRREGDEVRDIMGIKNRGQIKAVGHVKDLAFTVNEMENHEHVLSRRD